MSSQRKTWVRVEEDRTCDRPQCGRGVEAGTPMWYARLRDNLYCTPECREKHPRLLVQRRRRELVPAQKVYERNHKLQKKYGITPEEWTAMVARQRGACPICWCALADARASVDHDHGTGKVRGILCSNCNVGIGYFKDDPALLASAIEYLKAASASASEVAG